MSEDKDYPCNQLQCHNNGVCTDVGSDGIFECLCNHGFKGDNCEIEINNNCTSGMNACGNASQCVFDYDHETYDCFCPLTPYPRAGQFCEESEMTVSCMTVNQYRFTPFYFVSQSFVCG